MQGNLTPVTKFITSYIIYSSQVKFNFSLKCHGKLFQENFFLMKKQKCNEIRELFSFRAIP